ncbi:hypothetical protein ACFX13_003438 [Malus domestica]
MPKHSAVIPVIGDDYLLRGDDGHNCRRTDDVTLRSLGLAPTVQALCLKVPFLDLLVHLQETSLHGVLPLYGLTFDFFSRKAVPPQLGSLEEDDPLPPSKSLVIKVIDFSPLESFPTLRCWSSLYPLRTRNRELTSAAFIEALQSFVF